MKLSELLEPHDYSIVAATANRFLTRATIGKRDISFFARRDDDKIWTIMFQQSPIGKPSEITYKATGGRHEFKVMSMVASSLQEFKDRYHPDEIWFSAVKEGGKSSRPSIYKRIFTRVCKDYELAKEIDDESGEVMFLYRSKRIIPANSSERM